VRAAVASPSFHRLSSPPLFACSELEVARGWSATDDRVLQAAAREPPAAGAPLPSALRGRTLEQVAARCHFLGCVLPRPFAQAEQGGARLMTAA